MSTINTSLLQFTFTTVLTHYVRVLFMQRAQVQTSKRIRWQIDKLSCIMQWQCGNGDYIWTDTVAETLSSMPKVKKSTFCKFSHIITMHAIIWFNGHSSAEMMIVGLFGWLTWFLVLGLTARFFSNFFFLCPSLRKNTLVNQHASFIWFQSTH